MTFDARHTSTTFLLLQCGFREVDRIAEEIRRRAADPQRGVALHELAAVAGPCDLAILAEASWDRLDEFCDFLLPGATGETGGGRARVFLRKRIRDSIRFPLGFPPRPGRRLLRPRDPIGAYVLVANRPDSDLDQMFELASRVRPSMVLFASPVMGMDGALFRIACDRVEELWAWLRTVHSMPGLASTTTFLLLDPHVGEQAPVARIVRGTISDDEWVLYALLEAEEKQDIGGRETHSQEDLLELLGPGYMSRKALRLALRLLSDRHHVSETVQGRRRLFALTDVGRDVARSARAKWRDDNRLADVSRSDS